MHLVDAHLTSDPGKYLAAALLSLSTMLHLGLPHINALSKVISRRRPSSGRGGTRDRCVAGIWRPFPWLHSPLI